MTRAILSVLGRSFAFNDGPSAIQLKGVWESESRSSLHRSDDFGCDSARGTVSISRARSVYFSSERQLKASALESALKCPKSAAKSVSTIPRTAEKPVGGVIGEGALSLLTSTDFIWHSL